MDHQLNQELAKQLREAHITRKPCNPLREKIGVTDLDTAYAIQQINTAWAVENGASIIGRKIGLTSKAVQTQLGVDQPDFGTLLNTMEVMNGDSISVKELLQPKAEAEIAFILKKDLNDPNLSTAQLLSAIDFAVASIEIVGSRVANWDIKITDTIADNASASHFVIGHRPVKLEHLDLVNCRMEMSKNGAVVAQGNGAACLGSPINAALWLARTSCRLGVPLSAGEVILSGALGPMTDVKAGDALEAKFDGLGTVSVHFTE